MLESNVLDQFKGKCMKLMQAGKEASLGLKTLAGNALGSLFFPPRTWSTFSSPKYVKYNLDFSFNNKKIPKLVAINM